jgi:uncharacterized protein YegJ (DUF2314 family)
MMWIVIGVVVLIIAALAYWWRRRRNRHRLVSFVALVREPVTFDPAILASVAGRTWNADLGDGTSEGSDGFVVCADVINTIMHEDRMFLVNSFPTSYVEDVEQTAESIGDPRIRSLFSEHKAWYSFDALGVGASTSDEEILDWYQRLGKLFAEFLDDNCLLIFLPDAGTGYPINEDTEAALRSKDPVATLQATLTAPMIEVAPDDPLMVEAVEKARQDWPTFVAAYESRTGDNFSVKAPVTHGGNTEFIWISVTAIEGERIYGELGNDPADLGPLKYGSKVSVLVADLNDWCYGDSEGEMIGGFTIEALQKAARRG